MHRSHPSLPPSAALVLGLEGDASFFGDEQSTTTATAVSPQAVSLLLGQPEHVEETSRAGDKRKPDRDDLTKEDGEKEDDGKESAPKRRRLQPPNREAGSIVSAPMTTTAAAASSSSAATVAPAGVPTKDDRHCCDGGEGVPKKTEKPPGRSRDRPMFVPDTAGGQSLPDEGYRCTICSEIAWDPMMHCCGRHIFCRVCINQWSSTGKKSCPTCRDPDTKDIGVRSLKEANPFAFNVLAKAKVLCPRHDEAGCTWKGEYLDAMTVHLQKHCAFETLQCPHWSPLSGALLSNQAECSKYMLRAHVMLHLTSCPRRPVRCNKCGKYPSADSVGANHKSFCGGEIVKCSEETKNGCDKTMPRYLMPLHRATDCPSAISTCGLRGCGMQFKNSDWEKHTSVCKHIGVLMSECKLIENHVWTPPAIAAALTARPFPVLPPLQSAIVIDPPRRRQLSDGQQTIDCGSGKELVVHDDSIRQLNLHPERLRDFTLIRTPRGKLWAGIDFYDNSSRTVSDTWSLWSANRVSSKRIELLKFHGHVGTGPVFDTRVLWIEELIELSSSSQRSDLTPVDLWTIANTKTPRVSRASNVIFHLRGPGNLSVRIGRSAMTDWNQEIGVNTYTLKVRSQNGGKQILETLNCMQVSRLWSVIIRGDTLFVVRLLPHNFSSYTTTEETLDDEDDVDVKAPVTAPLAASSATASASTSASASASSEPPLPVPELNSLPPSSTQSWHGELFEGLKISVHRNGPDMFAYHFPNGAGFNIDDNARSAWPKFRNCSKVYFAPIRDAEGRIVKCATGFYSFNDANVSRYDLIHFQTWHARQVSPYRVSIYAPETS